MFFCGSVVIPSSRRRLAGPKLRESSRAYTLPSTCICEDQQQRLPGYLRSCHFLVVRRTGTESNNFLSADARRERNPECETHGDLDRTEAGRFSGWVETPPAFRDPQ